MELKNKPVPLPLQPGITRCLGHWNIQHENCPESERCARHLTIRHRKEVAEKPPVMRACSSNEFTLMIPIGGFGDSAEVQGREHSERPSGAEG